MTKGLTSQRGSNSIAINLSTFCLVKGIVDEHSGEDIASVLCLLSHARPNPFTTPSWLSVNLSLVAWSFSRVAATTSGELEIHFLAFVPAHYQRASSCWYNSMPSASVSTLSIESSIYVDFSIVSAAFGNSS